MRHVVFFAVFFSVAMFLLLTCAPTNDPYDPSKADVSLLYMSSNHIVSGNGITDTVGKHVSFGVRIYLTQYIDSALITVGTSILQLDTAFWYIPKKVKQTDTVWCDIVFSQPGDHIVNATAYVGKDDRKASGTIHIVSRPGQNNKPEIVFPGNRNVVAGQVCTFVVSATDPDPQQEVTIAMLKAPAAASFVNDTFAWITTASDIGVDTVIFTAHDDGSPELWDTSKVVITVSETLLPPEKPVNLTLIENIKGAITFSWNVSARADEYHIYQATAEPGPYTLQDTVTDTLFKDTLTPATWYYYVQAVNSAGVSPSSDTLIVAVVDTTVNHPPVFGANTPAASYSINEAAALKVPVKVTDPDGDVVTWTIVTNTLPRSGTATKANDTITWQSQTGDAGNYTITLRAKDQKDSTDVVVSVRVGDVNAPPAWKKKSMTVNVNEAQTYTLLLTDTVIDPDNDPLTFTLLSGAPAGDTINAQNQYVYSAGYSDSGTYAVRIVASDGFLADTLAMNLHVVNVNRKPVITGANDTTIMVGASITFTVSASDLDADPVTLAATGLPTGATFIATAGVFSWSPTTAQTGPFPITFTASDGTGTTSKAITITISNNAKPDITLDPVDQTVLAGQPDSFFVAATGAGTLTYQWQKNGTDLPGKTGTVLRIAAVAITDTGSYTCAVSNDGGKTTSKAARLTVQFTVSYDGNGKTGGTVPAGANYNFGTTVTVLGNTGALVKTGYTFTGWNTKPDGSGTSFAAAGTFTMGPANVILYAKWTQNVTFALTITATNGTVTKVPDLTAFDSGTVVMLTPVPSANYHFTGWGGALSGSANPATITMNAAKSVTATFTINAPNSFALTVLATNGTVTKTPDLPQYDSGSAVGLKATANAGYHFVNWSGDAVGTADSTTVVMTAARSVTANFAINTYQLTVAAGTGGTITAPATSPAMVNHGVATTITAAPITGYNFVNWTVTTGTATIASATSVSTTVTLTSGNATVTANFAIKTYQLTVNAGTGGTIIAPATSPSTVNHGVATTITEVPDAAYNFVNWTVTSGAATITNATSASTTVTLTSGNATVRANFSIKQYTMTFNSQSGSTVASQTVDYGGYATTPTAPIRSGYNFGGWYRQAACTNVWTFTTDIVTRDTTLYAKWTRQFTVTFNPQVCKTTFTRTVDTGTAVARPTTNPALANAAFVGWYAEKSGINEWNFSTPITADLTLWGKWTATDIDGNVYTIVTIGTQIWMAENLKTTRFTRGDGVPYVTDDAEWGGLADLVQSGYCWGMNDISYKDIYGALYNWFAVNDGALAPTGWHIPDSTEWATLVNTVGGETVAGGKLKEAGTDHWLDPNTDATNDSGFTALPGGSRNNGGRFFFTIGSSGAWWTTTPSAGTEAWNYQMGNGRADAIPFDDDKNFGFSVRCIWGN